MEIHCYKHWNHLSWHQDFFKGYKNHQRALSLHIFKTKYDMMIYSLLVCLQWAQGCLLIRKIRISKLVMQPWSFLMIFVSLSEVFDVWLWMIEISKLNPILHGGHLWCCSGDVLWCSGGCSRFCVGLTKLQCFNNQKPIFHIKNQF